MHPPAAIVLMLLLTSFCSLSEMESSVPTVSPLLWMDIVEIVSVLLGVKATHNPPEVRIRTVCAVIFIVAAGCHSGYKERLYNKAS